MGATSSRTPVTGASARTEPFSSREFDALWSKAKAKAPPLGATGGAPPISTQPLAENQLTPAQAREFLQEFERVCRVRVPAHEHTELLSFATCESATACSRDALRMACFRFATRWEVPLSSSMNPELFEADGSAARSYRLLAELRRDRESYFAAVPADLLTCVGWFLRPPPSVFVSGGVLSDCTPSVERLSPFSPELASKGWQRAP